ncbi:MAG: hypothetical protein FJ206_13220 [Gemmatimonadetes bacterium]|nr:hypothetical protein [Gemmatimonadota bacterium]
MVTRRRGASTLGCLFSLLITLVVLYYGMNVGRVWWRYYEILDRMKSAARFAQNQTDAAILSRLQADADEIGLPPAARQFRIQRSRGPAGMTISIRYSEKIELPFVHRSVEFAPSVSQRF